MSYTTIEEYNNYLIKNESNVDIIEYITEINKLEFNINISFIDEFIKFVGRKDFCIHHLMLQKYGVLKLKNGTFQVKELLIQNNFIENKDFKLPNVREFNGGRGNKKEYYLTPKAFKLCLIRSKNTSDYANYYLLLEDSIAYFKEYRDKLKDKLKDVEINILEKNIVQKDNKIDTLEEKINLLIETNKKQMNLQQEDRIEQRKKHKEQIEKSDEILKNNINITEKLVESHKKLDDITEELEDTNNNVRLIAKKLDIAVEDRVRRSNQSSTIEYLIILKSNIDINNYYIIRGQKRHIKVKIDSLKEYHKIKSIECVPNAITLFNLIKQNMKDNIYCKNNILNLIDINEDDFLGKIDNIYDERKIIEINS